MVRAGVAALALTAAIALTAPAHAGGVLSEVRLGVLDHDTRLGNGTEKGADINAELQFVSPVSDSFANRMPWLIRWFFKPRPMIGIDANTAGYTSQAYVGAAWTLLRVPHVFNSGDAITLDLGFGPALNNGDTVTRAPFHKSLGSNLLFRSSAELGYEVTPQIGVYVVITHSSNAGMSKHNPGFNDIGGRIGIRF